jgi:hypothetical protein
LPPFILPFLNLELLNHEDFIAWKSESISQ